MMRSHWAENQFSVTGPSELYLRSMVMVKWLPGEPNSDSSGWNVEYVIPERLLIEPDRTHGRVGGRIAQSVTYRSPVFSSVLRTIPLDLLDWARSTDRGSNMAQEIWKSHEIVSMCRSIDGHQMRSRYWDTVPRS
jgi:hypothetical protein